MSRIQLRAEERRWRRGDVWAVAGALLLGVALAWIVLSIQAMGHDLREERARGDALARQVKELGGTPVAGPSGEPGESVTGPPGPKGDKGDPGEPAPTITPQPGPTGPAGKDGADSTVPGPTGPPGADSTVPGPSGPPGVNGQDGADGIDGQPAAGWSFSYRGVEYWCGRVDGFDPGAPEYRCEQLESGPDPESGGGGVLLSLGLDPRRTLYV